MSDLASQFQTAVDTSKRLADKPDNATLLELYALYKQASVGDAEGERPGIGRFVDRAKWDAWSARAGTTRDDAMRAYIARIESLP